MTSAIVASHVHPAVTLELTGTTDSGVENTQGDDFAVESAPENVQSALLPVSKSRQRVILICAFFDVFITIGLNQAYGVFLNYYLDTTGHPHDQFLAPSQVSSKAFVAFVGTAAAGLTWAGSIFVNPLMSHTKDPRKLTLAGAVLVGLGYFLASFCDKVAS